MAIRRLLFLLLLALFLGQCYEPSHRAKGNILPQDLQKAFKPLDTKTQFYSDCKTIKSLPYQSKALDKNLAKLLKIPGGIPQGSLSKVTIPRGQFTLQGSYQAFIFDVLDTLCHAYTCVNILDKSKQRLTNFSHVFAYMQENGDFQKTRNGWFGDYDLDGKLDLINRTVVKKNGLVQKDRVEVKMWDMFEFRPLGMVNEKLLKEQYVIR